MARWEQRLVCLNYRHFGHTYDEIAQLTGLTPSKCRKLVCEAIEEANERSSKTAIELREKQNYRLMRYLKNLHDPVEMGDQQAISVALKVEERIAKLNGLDAPKEVDVRIRVSHLSLDEAREAVSRMTGANLPVKQVDVINALPGGQEQLGDLPFVPDLVVDHSGNER